MRIINVKTKNFKVLEDNEFIMDGEDFLTKGRNGIGKTSLGEAINWCMTGNSLTNNSKFTSVFKNDNCKSKDELSVEMLITHNDEEYFIRREDNPIKAYIDGYESTSLTMEILGISEEAFLLLFNPKYFASLSPKDSKVLLKKELKKVNVKEIYDKYPDEVKKVIDGHTKINKKIDNARNNIKETENDLIFLEGKKSNLEIKSVPDRIKFVDADELKAKKDFLDSIDRHHYQDNEKIIKLKKEIKELEKEKEEQTEKFDLNDELKAINKKYSNYELKKEKIKIKEDISDEVDLLFNNKKIIDMNKNEIHNVQDAIRKLKNEIEILKESLKQENKCPNCDFDLDSKKND